MENIYSVAALTEVVRKSLEAKLPFVWVRGEVSNLSRAASGHLYFVLKDSRAQLQCVWFAGKQRAEEKFDPLTGEVYGEARPKAADMLANGQEFLCAGAVSVYAQRGQYQLLVELAQPAGAGMLALEFERRKARLAAEGYFASERKRPLPENPAKIALITSPHGAAIHDFLELARNRGLSSKIRLFPVPVQGSDAVPKIAQAIRAANDQNWAQVIVLIRGGGSLEDLWAFNEEELARAIYESRLPVLAGIGHEIDISLADMTADIRAATPSHAAQLLWPLRSELWQNLDNAQLAMQRVMEQRLESACATLEARSRALNLLSPLKRLQRMRDDLCTLRKRMDMAIGGHVKYFWQKLQHLDQWFARPVVMQGEFRLRMDRLHNLEASLQRNMHLFIGKKENDLRNAKMVFDQLDPQAPLKRGYALIFHQNGQLAAPGNINAGEKFSAIMRDGVIDFEAIGEPRIMDIENGEDLGAALHGLITADQKIAKREKK